jgi:hypothetical protein
MPDSTLRSWSKLRTIPAAILHHAMEPNRRQGSFLSRGVARAATLALLSLAATALHGQTAPAAPADTLPTDSVFAHAGPAP